MATSNTNLDLSTTPTEEIDQLASKINTFYLADSNVKAQLSWNWERNQLMLDGKQWLMFQGDRTTGGQWQRASVSKNNEYIPRPVTNYLFSAYQTLKAYLIKNKPRSTVHPNTQTNKDKTAAKIANLILEGNWARLKEQYNYETAAANLLAYGTVFKKSYWDTSSVSMVKVPRMQMIPVTDPMSGQVIGQQEIQEVDPLTQEPQFDELPLGDVNTNVVDPFRMALDPMAMHLHEAKWIMEYTVQSLDWIRETYSKEADGYTGLAQDVKEDPALNGSLRRWYHLRNSSGSQANASGLGAGGGGESIENSAVVKEYYEKPSSKHPHGRLIVVAGEKTVYSGPSPCSGPELGDWHPYSECRWEITPGRFWGKSPLDDAAEIQKHINTIDSAIILTRKTMAMPQKLVPLGSGISPGEWTGRPGQQVPYRADGMAKPELLPGVGVHESVFAERAQRIADLKEITGAIDILRGDRPPGVNAASALSLLYEVGTGKLFPVLDRWKLFVEEDQKKQLRLIGKNYKEPRPDFIRMLKAKNSDLSEESINNFIGSDLHDNYNVVVEAGSNIPKLQAAKQSMLMELAQMNMLNLQDPSNRAQFQQDLGVQGYDQDISPDKKRAEWENDLLDSNNPDIVVLAIDNHALHLDVHQRRMKSPAFMALPAEVQQAYMAHNALHEQHQAQAAQAAMLQAMAMGAPAMPAGGTPIPSPMPAEPQGNAAQGAKGSVPSSIKKAVMGADILTPASLGSNR